MHYLLQDRVLNDTLLLAVKHESFMHFMHVSLYSMFTKYKGSMFIRSYSKQGIKKKETTVCELGLSA